MNNNIEFSTYSLELYNPNNQIHIKVFDDLWIDNNTQKYLYDDQIKRQCIGMCNSVVEDLALYFKRNNY